MDGEILRIRFEKNNTYYTMFINEKKCGTCSYVFSGENPTLIHIMYLNILDEYKNMGCGTVLLYEALTDAYHIKGATHVHLDDASDNCHKQNNIYVRIGLSYVYGKDDNSMHGNLRNILYGKKNYRSVYQNKFVYDA